MTTLTSNDGCKIFLRPECDETEIRQLLLCDEVTLRANARVRVVRDAAHALVLRVELPNAKAVYWKEFRACGLLDKIKDSIRSSRASRAFFAAMDCRSRGVPTAQPIAYGEMPRLCAFAQRRSFLVTEEIEAESVSDGLKRMLLDHSPEAVKTKRELFQNLGLFAARMHHVGVYHRDLQVTNVLWRKGKSPTDFLVIDTDRIELHASWNRRMAVRNLMQLSSAFYSGITISDRLRMIRAYAREIGLEPVAARRLAQQVFLSLRARLYRRLGRRHRLGVSKNEWSLLVNGLERRRIGPKRR